VLAFIGPSGQGKTTMAAFLAANGARVVADDVLVVDVDPIDRLVWGRRAATELRLRDGAQRLSDLLAGRGATLRQSVDGRLVVGGLGVEVPRVPVSAIVIPCPDEHAEKVEARRLSAPEAAHRLAASYRIEGWRMTEALRRQFLAVSEIADRVPVVDLHLPVDLAYSTRAAEQIIRKCDLTAGLGRVMKR
jgi:hypothetical protein